PTSVLADASVECTIVFIGPNGQFYYAPYAFVRGCVGNYKFENPTIFDSQHDVKIENGFFSLEMVICKLKNGMFELKDERNNGMCQIKRAPCGIMDKIDHEILLSWGVKENKTKMNRNDKNVTPHKLAKCLKVHTLYIMIRRTRFDPVENKFVPEPEILFCSNAFTPENGSVRPLDYDYSANKLIITKFMQSRAEPRESNHQFNVHVSYVIPPLYECTQLINKRIIVEILTGSEQESHTHPNYKFMTDEGVRDSICIRADQYESNAEFKIVKTTRNQCNDRCVQNTALPVSYHNGSDSMVQAVSFNEPSMNSFRVQLQLCDYTDQIVTPYPRSTVQSTLVVDDFVSSERSATSSSPVNENVIIENVFESSVTDKRSLEKEAHERTGSPLLKTPKIHDSSLNDCKDEEYDLRINDPHVTFALERDRLAETIKHLEIQSELQQNERTSLSKQPALCMWYRERECYPHANLILLYINTQDLAKIKIFQKNDSIQYRYAKGNIECRKIICNCPVREAAEELGLNPKTLDELIKNNKTKYNFKMI
ncbi:unnamed protein product, partial [Rotaria magnacalcarata]